jgi:hypothetical protein
LTRALLLLYLQRLQVSKGFAVAMSSLWAQQSARQLLLRLLAAERSKGAHLGSSLEGKDARLHDLDATVRQHQLCSFSADSRQQHTQQVMKWTTAVAMAHATWLALLGSANCFERG